MSKLNLCARYALVLLALAAAGQDKAKDKIKNLEALAKQGRAAVPLIRPWQQDADASVRYAAVEALIEAGGVESVDALQASLADATPEVQRLAVAGIVNFYRPGYVRKGIRARLNAVGEKISRSGGEPVVDPWVAVRSQDIEAVRKTLREAGSRDVKLQAAEALATLRARGALADLYPLLKTKDDGLMLAALRAIETAGDKAAAQETVFLLRDLNDRIQSRVILVNGIFRNEKALPDLAEVFARGRNAQSRAAALEAIAMIAAPESRGLFEQNLENKEERLRGLAAEGLGRVGDGAARQRLEGLFEAEKTPRGRLGQAFALVKLGNREASQFSPFQYLFDSLNSAAWHDYAEAYLLELGRHGEVRKLLRERVPTGTRAEKAGIARILAREGTAEDRGIVDALANDRDRIVAEEGIKAARALGSRLP